MADQQENQALPWRAKSQVAPASENEANETAGSGFVT